MNGLFFNPISYVYYLNHYKSSSYNGRGNYHRIYLARRYGIRVLSSIISSDSPLSNQYFCPSDTPIFDITDQYSDYLTLHFCDKCPYNHTNFKTRGWLQGRWILVGIAFQYHSFYYEWNSLHIGIILFIIHH